MVHGVEQPGKLVDPSTRLAHEKRDRCPSSPSLGRHRQQSSPKTKSREGKHNKGKGNNLNRMPFSSHPWVGLEFLLPGSAKPTIEKLVCGIVIWLYIRVGVSRSVAISVLQAIHYLITTIISLLAVALSGQDINMKLPDIRIPCDVRSVYRQYFSEPKLTQTMCCPKCFKTFTCPVNEIPFTCQWKASRRSRPCGAALWKRQRTCRGWKKVARCLITTQKLEPWLRFWLSRKQIDNALQETSRKQAQRPPLHGSEMRDVHDSPGWRNLYGNEQYPYNLVFGIYIDWFQVFGMRIAGE